MRDWKIWISLALLAGLYTPASRAADYWDASGRARYAAAVQAYYRANYRDAAEWFLALARDLPVGNPYRPLVYYYLGNARYQLGQSDLADEAYGNCLSANPDPKIRSYVNTVREQLRTASRKSMGGSSMSFSSLRQLSSARVSTLSPVNSTLATRNAQIDELNSVQLQLAALGGNIRAADSTRDHESDAIKVSNQSRLNYDQLLMRQQMLQAQLKIPAVSTAVPAVAYAGGASSARATGSSVGDAEKEATKARLLKEKEQSLLELKQYYDKREAEAKTDYQIEQASPDPTGINRRSTAAPVDFFNSSAYKDLVRERDDKVRDVESAYSAKVRNCEFPGIRDGGFSRSSGGLCSNFSHENEILSGNFGTAGSGSSGKAVIAAGNLVPGSKLARLERDYARELVSLEEEHQKRKAYIDDKYSEREDRLNSLRAATLSGDDDKVRDLTKMITGKSQMYSRSIDPNSVIKNERASISSDKENDYTVMERVIDQARQNLDRAYQSLRQQIATGGGVNALMPQYTDLNVRQYINFGGSEDSSSYSSPSSAVRDYKPQNFASPGDLRARAGRLEDLARDRGSKKINKVP